MLYLALMVVNIFCQQFEKAQGIINNRHGDDIIIKCRNVLLTEFESDDDVVDMRLAGCFTRAR
jgi:hypothetical protein